jgi:hypothetical protein
MSVNKALLKIAEAYGRDRNRWGVVRIHPKVATALQLEENSCARIEKKDDDRVLFASIGLLYDNLSPLIQSEREDKLNYARMSAYTMENLDVDGSKAKIGDEIYVSKFGPVRDATEIEIQIHNYLGEKIRYKTEREQAESLSYLKDNMANGYVAVGKSATIPFFGDPAKISFIQTKPVDEVVRCVPKTKLKIFLEA